MVSLITDADHSTCTVAVAAAEPRASFTDINMVHSPALSLSGPVLLNPAELGGPGNIQQITKGLHCFSWQQRKVLLSCYQEPMHKCDIMISPIFVCSYPEETWSGSWTVTLVHIELFTGL